MSLLIWKKSIETVEVKSSNSNMYKKVLSFVNDDCPL